MPSAWFMSLMLDLGQFAHKILDICNIRIKLNVEESVMSLCRY